MEVPGSAVVIVPTYKRNAWLQELLDVLVAQLEGLPDSVVLVVDNSLAGEAADIAAAAARTSASRVRYVHEPVPGIVAARNCALTVISESSHLWDFIVFIDDDELPSEDWLKNLLSALAASKFDAAIGPVVPILPDTAPAALRVGGFFDRIRLSTGAVPPWGTTNNTAIRSSALRSMQSPHFSNDFSMSGGSDAEFFWRFTTEGKSLMWVDEAIVYERFNQDRATWKWITRRNIRLGNVSARLKLRTQPRLTVFVIGVARLCYGAVISFARIVSLRPPTAVGYAHLFKGIGMVSEVFGSRVVEYQRKSALP